MRWLLISNIYNLVLDCSAFCRYNKINRFILLVSKAKSSWSWLSWKWFKDFKNKMRTGTRMSSWTEVSGSYYIYILYSMSKFRAYFLYLYIIEESKAFFFINRLYQSKNKFFLQNGIGNISQIDYIYFT